jgi:hypothetical protein
LLTFGVVFTLLEVTRSAAAPSPSLPVPIASPTPVQPVVDSLAQRIGAGRSAVGVPIVGSELLVRDLQPGDRVDVLASLASPDDGRPVTAVVVRGASVLRQATTGEPLLLEVPPPDAMLLAHLVLSGTRLGYSVWPASGESPPQPRPLDERTARALLGLPPLPGTSKPQAKPSPEPGLLESGFLYQVQPGDTWDSVAAIFDVSPAELRLWNELPPDAHLDTWSLLFIRRKS